MPTATTYDLSWIMARAWAEMRRRGRYCRRLFASCLRAAWSDAKAKAKGARLIEELSPAEKALIALQNKNHLTPADHDRIAELRKAVAHEKAAPDYAAKRTLIERAGGRFCAITFTKKDGSERIMKVQPANLRHHVKGDDATEAGRKAVATPQGAPPEPAAGMGRR